MVSYSLNSLDYEERKANPNHSKLENSLGNPSETKTPINTARLLKIHLVAFIASLDPFYRYELTNNPKRILTKPSKGVHNNLVDNSSYDYILAVGDLFGCEESRRFIILDLLGQGTFGQVVKCQNLTTGEFVAIKIIKNQTAYFNQSMMEVTILEMLNSSKYTDQERMHITRMKDTFVFKKHLCIVFELLSLNIFELLKQNHFKGFSHQLIRIFLQQILSALCLLNEAKIVHCDLKPENILLQSMDSAFIKVIDFGSACHEQHTVYTYIQSRFYRSPEVILGLPYSSSIDIWSLGCIAAELFLGIPIFPGTSNYDQICRIIECVGMPPNYMLEMGRNAGLYFEKATHTGIYKLKDQEQYSKDIDSQNPHKSNGAEEKPSKRYFSAVKLEEILMTYPMKSSSLSQKEVDKEIEMRRSLNDLISNLLNINPIERWSPQQARLHPYILGEPWKGPFIPPGPACISSPTTSHSMSMVAGYSHHNNLQTHHHRTRSSTINSQMYSIPPNLERITRMVTNDSYASLRSIPGSSMYQQCSNSVQQQQQVSSFNLNPRNSITAPDMDRNSLLIDTIDKAYMESPKKSHFYGTNNQANHYNTLQQNRYFSTNRSGPISTPSSSIRRTNGLVGINLSNGYATTLASVSSPQYTSHRRLSNPSNIGNSSATSITDNLKKTNNHG